MHEKPITIFLGWVEFYNSQSFIGFSKPTFWTKVGLLT